MFGLTSIICVLLGLLLYIVFERKRRPGEPPLVKGWVPFLGKAFEFGKDAQKFLNVHKDKYGDIFTIRIAGKYMTFIMDPLLYPYVIKHGKQLDFHEFSDQVAPMTFGYPCIRDPKFPGMAEHIQRAFQYLQGDSLTSLIESMRKNLIFLFQQDYLNVTEWRMEKMHHFCKKIMFEATFLTLFGKPPHANRHLGMDALREKFEKFDAKFPLLIMRIPISLLGETKTIRDDLINFFLPQKMAQWLDPAAFIQQRTKLFEQYELLGDVDIAAHHFAILWASVGNTLPASFWAMYYLVMHPEALAVVRGEIDHVLQLTGQEAGSGHSITLTREQLDSLVYLGSTINESLRLSSASMNIRIAQEDFTLGFGGDRSIGVRKGDVIVLYPQSLHMDPEIFEDPEVFKFDRFIEDGKEKTSFYKHGQKLKFYLMPFGSGVTKCPGRYFAINEMKQFLTLLIAHFDIEIVQGEGPVKPDQSRVGLGILLPDSDIQFRYKTRIP